MPALQTSPAVAVPLLLALLGALLAACASTPPDSSGRYSIAEDRAPTRRIDPDSIEPVVPEPVVRTSAGNRSPYTVLGRSYTVLPTEEGYSARGIASWYGEKFHGHKTSNGEVFDMYQLTAAHRNLPIPSYLRVVNLDNNRSIVVRVNDRGPFHNDRIIDLSYAAAVKLGFADRGTARVQLEAVTAAASRGSGIAARSSAPGPEAAGAIGAGAAARAGQSGPTAGVERLAAELARSAQAPAAADAGIYLQVGAFSASAAAEEVSHRVRALTNSPVFIRQREEPGRGTLHQVRVGPIHGPEEVRRLTLLLVAAELGSPYTVRE